MTTTVTVTGTGTPIPTPDRAGPGVLVVHGPTGAHGFWGVPITCLSAGPRVHGSTGPRVRTDSGAC